MLQNISNKHQKEGKNHNKPLNEYDAKDKNDLKHDNDKVDEMDEWNMFEVNYKQQQQENTRFTGYCIIPIMRNRPYGYIKVDKEYEEDEIIRVYQHDLPYDWCNIYEGDLFEFGMFVIIHFIHIISYIFNVKILYNMQILRGHHIMNMV